jgi:hypothetical protein
MRAEYRLVVHPVFLGGGLPLVTERLDLQFLGARAFPTGAIALTYGRGSLERMVDQHAAAVAHR